MRESSPAFGGAVMAASVVCSLAYAMGDGHALMNFLLTEIGQAGNVIGTAFETVRGILASLQ